MKRKRRVSFMVVMNMSRSAGDGPLTITYSSPRQKQPTTSTVTMMKPATLSQKRILL